MQKYEKGKKQVVSTHFSSTDFDCHCHSPNCKQTFIDSQLVAALEELWILSQDFQITSGFRCNEHNDNVGGQWDSQHLLGKAADCKSLKGYNGHLMANYAELVLPFQKGGIGIYPSFVHCDVRKRLARWAHPSVC